MTCIEERKRPIAPARLLMVLGILALAVAGAQAQEHTSGTNTVFVVDTSKSMVANHVFEPVRNTLIDYINQLHPGDHVILLGFDADVRILADDDIRNDADIATIVDKAKELRATGDWTYMTHALDIAATQAGRLQSTGPNRKQMIYLFTDGKNEPPPTVKEALTFSDILKKHFKFYASDNTSLYVLSLVKPEPDLEEFQKKIGDRATIKQSIELKEVEIEVSFGNQEWQWSNGSANSEATLTLKRLVNSTGIKLQLLPEVENLSAQLRADISPAEVECRGVNQSEKLVVTLSGKAARADFRTYHGRLRVQAVGDEVRVVPGDAAFEFTLSRSGMSTPLLVAILVIVAGLVYWASRQLLPKAQRRVWVQAEGKERALEATLASGAQVWLGKGPSGQSLDLGLPHYYLTVGRDSCVRLGDSRTGKEESVEMDRPVVCHEDQTKINLVCSQSPPRQEELAKAEAGGDSLPDEMRDI